MPGLRVVLDTNVLVSGLAYPASVPGKIMAAWRQGAIDVVLSRYILITSGADDLITGDADLLAVADRHPILTPAQVWSRHGG